jgi:UDP-N-acetylmuramate--alanine ligase
VVLTDGVQSIARALLETLSDGVNVAGGTCRHVVRDRAEAAVRAAAQAQPGDVVVLMGTGDIAEAGQVLRATLGDLLPVTA